MSPRLLAVLALIALATAVGGAGAAGDLTTANASAQAWAVRVSTGGGTATVQAPPSGSPSYTGGFAYPADGSVISTGATSAAASTTIGNTNSVGKGSADVSSVSIFGGEITIDAVSARAVAGAQAGGASGNFDGTGVSGFQALGQGASGGRVNLADWGYAVVNSQSADTSAPDGIHGYRGSVLAVVVRLTADHGGLPAGSEIQLGYAEASAQSAPPPPPAPPKPATTAKTETQPASQPHDNETDATAPRSGSKPKPKPKTPKPVFRVAPRIHPPLTAGRYVFPVYGPASYIDSFGAARADVSYHHGVDIFGQLGQPLVAVADGTCSPSDGTASAATACGSATAPGTSSTTLICPRSRRSR